MFDAFYDMLDVILTNRFTAYRNSLRDSFSLGQEFYLNGLSLKSEFINYGDRDVKPQTAVWDFDHNRTLPKFVIYYNYIPEDRYRKSCIVFCIKHNDMEMITRGRLFAKQMPPAPYTKPIDTLEQAVIEARRCYDS